MNQELVTAIGRGLIHSLWQGAFVVAIAGALMALAGNRSRVRYAILCLALASLVAAPIVTVALVVDQTRSQFTIEAVSHAGPLLNSAPVAEAATGPSQVGGAPDRSFGSWAPRWVDRGLPFLVLGWIVGVGFSLLRLGGAWVVLRRMIARATPAPADIAKRAATMANRLGLTRAVRILVSAEVGSPWAAGLLRPVILLPAAALSGLSPFQLDLILTHELAHIRRWDYLVNLLQTVAETLLFFHPAAWWLSRRIRIEREYCCDDLVVETVADPLRYARALADLESMRAAAPRLASGWRDGSLGDRIERLVGQAAPRPALGWLPVAVALLCLGAVARVGAAPTATVPSPVAIGEVVRHSDPHAPLGDRWTWAFAEARRRGWREVTVAWGIRSANADGDLVVSSTRGGSAQDRGAVVGPLLGEPEGPGVAFFLSFAGLDQGGLDAVALRSTTARYSPRGANIVWLGRAPDRASIDQIERLMNTAGPDLRSELGAAVTLHDDAALVLAASRRIVHDESDIVRAELLSWLPRQLPSPEIHALLVEGLRDRSPAVRDEALSALADSRGGGAWLLDAITNSPYPDVRSEAIQALGDGDRVNAEQLVRALRRAAFEDPDPEVQREAGDALLKLGRAAATRRGER